ncbi:hypothetical protein [Bifidobacterium phasiani]|uniref:Uncharacterized protein n=1 Tax=Bifidobacterium phasiani TaxID=2834431 RepID=A0ABS6W639_9BIFI|nr:hypothetical protein [Bifidobacterium phasiani]MBW3081955.1 hypothetical protein [Bifidobacterium phasiani]
MRFVNWWPDPRFTHTDRWDLNGCSAGRWSSGRGVDVVADSGSLAYFKTVVFSVPAGEWLNIVATVECVGADPNLQWGYILMLYDASRPASDSSAIIASVTKSQSGVHQVVRFQAPSSGLVRFQGVCPLAAGAQTKISLLSVVSDAGLAWMREHGEWWIHSQLMPLRSS